MKIIKETKRIKTGINGFYDESNDKMDTHVDDLDYAQPQRHDNKADSTGSSAIKLLPAHPH